MYFLCFNSSRLGAGRDSTLESSKKLQPQRAQELKTDSGTTLSFFITLSSQFSSQELKVRDDQSTKQLETRLGN